jgi:hypothetical protein
VTDAAIEVWGAGRVGVHLAPRADAHDMGDANRAETFTYVARELGKRGIAFICSREKEGDDSLGPLLKEAFGGPYIVNERFTKPAPMLPWPAARPMPWLSASRSSPTPTCQHAWPDAPLNAPHPETFMARGPVGYIDYPRL